jgi:hypothetical protein
MSSIVVAGDSSGSITIAAPAVAGSGTLTLPVATDTLIGKATTDTLTNKTLTAPTITGATITVAATAAPAFRAYASTAQTVTTGVATKVTFDTETFDTNSNFASSRFTPTVAGYYQLNAIIRYNGTAPTQYSMYYYKNGAALGINLAVNVTLGLTIQTTSTLVYLNGSTDYVEVYADTIATSPTLGAASANTNYFSGSMVRSA